MLFYSKKYCLRELSKLMTPLARKRFGRVNFLDQITLKSIGNMRKIYFNHWKEKEKKGNVLVAFIILILLALTILYIQFKLYKPYITDRDGEYSD